MERAQFKTDVLNKDVIFFYHKRYVHIMDTRAKRWFKKKLVVEFKWTLYISSVINTSTIHLNDRTQVSSVSACCNFFFFFVWQNK